MAIKHAVNFKRGTRPSEIINYLNSYLSYAGDCYFKDGSLHSKSMKYNYHFDPLHSVLVVKELSDKDREEIEKRKNEYYGTK